MKKKIPDIKYLKRIVFFSLIFLTIFYMLLSPASALQNSADGIRLWFHTLLPALLPFLILSGILTSSGVPAKVFGLLPGRTVNPLGLSCDGMYAFALGLFCGYPMGAKLAADLWRSGRISKREAQYLVMTANNPGPVFVSGYLLHQLLQADHLKAAAFTLLYTSLLLCCLLFRPVCARLYPADASEPSTKKEVSEVPLPELLDTSIMNGFETVTKLGGYILLFSLLSGILEQILPPSGCIGSLIMAVNELTSGSARIAKLPWEFSMRFSVILGAASFGGISCMFQTSSMIRGTGLSLGMYALAKTVNGLLTFVLCRLLFFFVL